MSGIRGDEDVFEAHIDACLIHQGRRAEEERLRALEDVDPTMEGAAGHVGNVTGMRKNSNGPIRGKLIYGGGKVPVFIREIPKNEMWTMTSI